MEYFAQQAVSMAAAVGLSLMGLNAATGEVVSMPKRRGAIAGAGGHMLALKVDGTLWSSGSNDLGQIGDGTTDYRESPVQITWL